LLDEELEKIQQSPTMHLAREVGSPTHRVQLMKASFFMEEEGDLEPGKFLCNLIVFAFVNYQIYHKLHKKDLFLKYEIIVLGSVVQSLFEL
jgi:hypothetical protein